MSTPYDALGHTFGPSEERDVDGDFRILKCTKCGKEVNHAKAAPCAGEPIRVVAARILAPWNDGKVLLCRRSLDRDYANAWEFPGGKVDPADLVEATARDDDDMAAPEEVRGDRVALRRELNEELALGCTIGALLATTPVLTTDTGLRFIVALYEATIVLGEATPDPKVHGAISWWDRAQLRTEVNWSSKLRNAPYRFTPSTFHFSEIL